MNREAIHVVSVLVFAVLLLCGVLRADTRLLTSPGGDSSVEGGLSMLVDQYGAFGHYEFSSGAIFNPYGSFGPANTTYQSGVHLSGPGFSSFLSTGPLANLAGGSFTSLTPTAAVSSFSAGGLNFSLSQEVRDRFDAGVKKGSQLVQTYTVTNSTASTLNFSMARYVDGDLYFEGGFSNDWGGVSSYTPTMDQTLFEYDSGDNPSNPTTYLGIRSLGGTVPTQAFEIRQYPDLRTRINGGVALSNTVQGDLNGDRVTDSPYDISLGQRRDFSVQAGGTTTYVAVTDFGQGQLGEAPIPDIPAERQTGRLTSGPFGWDYSYDLSFTDQHLEVDLDIQLVGDDPGQALRDQWEQGIEGIWSNHYEIVDGTLTYPIVFDAEWVNSDADHVVTVHAGTGPTNMLNWYTDHPSGWENIYQDEIAAHEAGHMVGVYDEYAGGAVDPLTGFTTTNALMADLGPVQDRYFLTLLDWLENQSGRDLSLANAPYPPYPHDPTLPDFIDPQAVIPAPAAGLCVWIGLGTLAFLRRKLA